MCIKNKSIILLTMLGYIKHGLSADVDTCSSVLEVIHENNSLSFAETVFNTSSGLLQWCSSNNIVYEKDNYWIEFDLKQVHIITALEIRTLHKNNMSEFSQPILFDFNYTRPVLKEWVNKWNVLMTETGIKYELKQHIWAKQIRIVPILEKPVCLSVQLYGCLWSEGLVSYTMPPNDIGEKDYYDGELAGEVLKNGLGQLVDGVNHTVTGEDRVKRWIGWHDSTKMNSVELVFEFDDVKTFDSVQLIADNDISRDVEVFKIAEVTFSADGQNFSHPPLCYHHSLNDNKTGAQTIALNLNCLKGKFVKLNLYFKSKWIYLSEVNFKQAGYSILAYLSFDIYSIIIVLTVLVLFTALVIVYKLYKKHVTTLLLKKKSELKDENYNDDYLKPREDQNMLDPMYETLDNYSQKQKHEKCYNELHQLLVDKVP